MFTYKMVVGHIYSNRLYPYWLKSLTYLEPSFLKLIPKWLKSLRFKPKDLSLGMLSYIQRGTHLGMILDIKDNMFVIVLAI